MVVFSRWWNNSSWFSPRTAYRETLYLEIAPPVQGPRFEQWPGKKRGTKTSSLDKYIICERQKTTNKQMKFAQIMQSKASSERQANWNVKRECFKTWNKLKLSTALNSFQIRDRIYNKSDLQAWPSCFVSFKHFLKQLSSFMINAVANLMLLKNVISNPFKECKRYFVYTEITRKCLIG